MGGYGSGRRVAAHLTSECLTLDMMHFLNHGYLIGKELTKEGRLFYAEKQPTFEKKWEKAEEPKKKQGLYFRIERYGGEPGKFEKWHASGHLTLSYAVKQGDEKPVPIRLDIPLVVTHPNYGGQRWWYLAPCCGCRVRVLYLPMYGSLDLHWPECRECLELNYASQRHSYIERHKTYERHLLANYGWAWAEMDYHSLREHYQEITPELEYARQSSILQMRMRMFRLLMSSTRVMMRMHMHALRSLRSEEEHRVYVDHLGKEHGESYMMDLVRMFRLGARMERQARESSSQVFDQAYEQLEALLAQSLESQGWLADPDTWQAIAEASEQNGKINMRYLLAYKKVLEEDLERLEELKKAA